MASRRAIHIPLAKDRSKRPLRGQPAGEIVTGPCEAVGCGVTLHRGDEFVVYLGDRPMCRGCHVAGKPLIPIAGAPVKPPRLPPVQIARAKRQMHALRRARRLKAEMCL